MTWWPDSRRSLTGSNSVWFDTDAKRPILILSRPSHLSARQPVLSCVTALVFMSCGSTVWGGDRHLTDSTYQTFCNAAEATLSRDKNHQCVIIWSVAMKIVNFKILKRLVNIAKTAIRPVRYLSQLVPISFRLQAFLIFSIFIPSLPGAEWVRISKETSKPVIYGICPCVGLSLKPEDIWRDYFAAAICFFSVWHYRKLSSNQVTFLTNTQQ
jgi:hypothetical protein